jgi:cyclase
MSRDSGGGSHARIGALQAANGAMMRRFLAVTLALLFLSSLTSAQDAVEPPFTLKQVGPNVWAAISNPKSKTQAGANTGFVVGDDGVVVIDTTESVDGDGNFNVEPARQLLAAIRKVTNLPVRFVVNTHYHLDHVGANSVFVDAGATVLAQRNVLAWIHSENLRMFGNDIKPQHRTFIEATLPPTVTYEQSADIHLGSRTIHLRSLPGHTGGDTVVVIPDAKVVFAGDLFWRDMVPNLIDASTQPWIDTLDTLANVEAEVTFVPGHGDVGTARDVAAFRDYLIALRKLISETQALGKSGDALADAVMPALSNKYKGWDAFEYLAKPNILQTADELSGKKRIPKAQLK